MKAARFHARGDIRIEDIPEPTVAPGTVGIDVAWCGICGTDLHEFMEGPIFIPPCGHPHPISGESAPVTMGHEFSGVVYAVGEGVTDIQVGQHVVVEPYIIADDVPTGPGERYHLSKDMNFIGLGGRGGGLSEKIAVQRRWVHPISNALPLDQAALIEPLSVGHHAFVRSGAKAGDVALVGGGGPIGLLLAAVLKAKGLKVIITELSATRKEKARESGVAELLPSVEVALFDEAHQLAEAGVQFLGTSLGSAQVLDFARDLLATGLQQARGLAPWQERAAGVELAARRLPLAACASCAAP